MASMDGMTEKDMKGMPGMGMGEPPNGATAKSNASSEMDMQNMPGMNMSGGHAISPSQEAGMKNIPP
ncbi:MAG TPA: hypothetical protein VMF66_07390, partial [Candidatus Acidoferrum sp.]|nr:hypothetical protein [Candidatus Acidoferrum sp.]